MYSIIRQGGMQFQAEKGKNIDVPYFDAEVGTEFELKEVLLFSDDKVHVGRPLVENAVVSVKVISHARKPKITVFKHKRRKRYRKTTGHRQQFVRLEVLDMKYNSEDAVKEGDA